MNNRSHEILPGIFHWTVDWPEIFPLESYHLLQDDLGVLIDPVESSQLVLPQCIEKAEAVIIMSSSHERSARLFAKRANAKIYVPEDAVNMLEDLEIFETYKDGDILPGNLLAISISGDASISGEHALLSPLHDGTLFVADCLGTTAKWTPWNIPLGAHPIAHPQPSRSLASLLTYSFENLLPGHGRPIVGGAKIALRDLLNSGVRQALP